MPHSPEFWRQFYRLKPRLRQRAGGFEFIFKHLDGFVAPVILETGCVRREDSMETDGASTVLFDLYAQHAGAAVGSVDKNPENCRIAAKLCQKALIHEGDSVEFLKGIQFDGEPLALLYLDSYDCDWNDPRPSQEHHLAELMAALPLIGPETLVVVDDCGFRSGEVRGKGGLVAQYARGCGAELVLAEYQCAWRGIR